MSTGPKYGHIIGDGHGVRHKLTSGQYFNEKGGHFVETDSTSGYASLIDATSEVPLGWADTGKLYGYGTNYFVSVSGSDALVITETDAVYRVPAMSAVTAADIGKRYMIAYTGTGKTSADFIQKIRNTGTTVSGGKFEVVDVDAEDIANQTLQVRIV